MRSPRLNLAWSWLQKPQAELRVLQFFEQAPPRPVFAWAQGGEKASSSRAAGEREPLSLLRSLILAPSSFKAVGEPLRAMLTASSEAPTARRPLTSHGVAGRRARARRRGAFRTLRQSKSPVFRCIYHSKSMKHLAERWKTIGDLLELSD